MRCEATGSCITGCRCRNRTNTLQCLISVYLRLREANDFGSNFVRGHLAILFGVMMENGDDNRTLLLASLPGSSPNTKLGDLAKEANDIALLYADVTWKLMQAHTQAEAVGCHDTDLVHDLQSRIKQTMRFSAGEGSTRKIVTFLESLRDQTM